MEDTGNAEKHFLHPYRSDSEDARIWMESFIKGVRNCSYYHEEYKDCASLRGRLYSRYTYGEKLDCSHWSKAYEMCKKVKKDKDEEALSYIVEHEILRREFRLRSARENDVWEYRIFPPDDWATVPGKKSVNPDDKDNRNTDNSDTDKSDPKIAYKSDNLQKDVKSDNSQKDEKTLMEEIFASKPKVNPKYDNTVQRCVIL